MKKLTALILPLLFLLAVWPTDAQEPQTDWDIVILDQDTPALLIIGPNGSIEEIDLRELPDEIDLTKPSAMEVSISLNRNRLAYYDARSQVYIADLEPTVSCCIQLPPFTEEEEEVTGIALDDEGKRLAVGTTYYAPGARIAGKITVYDLETLSVLNTLLSDARNSYGRPAATQMDWLPSNHIRFLPSCWACEPNSWGFYWEWDPDTDELAQTQLLWSVIGESLVNTEFITTQRLADYPFSGMEDYFGLMPNVVAYYANPRWIMDDLDLERTVVYFDREATFLEEARWVQDGQAFVVFAYSEGETNSIRHQIFVHRDGTQLEVEPGFAIGTPDGWVAHDDSRVLWHYTYTPEGGVERQELLQLPDRFSLLEKPILGASVAQKTFTAIPPYDWGEPVCEGALPTHLNVGGRGYVTTGAANNLRAQPNTESEKLGEISGGSMFRIVAGPECTPGMTWWQVEYNGLVGWTAEGQGSTYWVESAGWMSFD